MHRQVISGLGRRLMDVHSDSVSSTYLPRIRHLPSPLHRACMRLRTRVYLGYRRASRRAPQHDLVDAFKHFQYRNRQSNKIWPCKGRGLTPQIDGTYLCVERFSSLTRVTECGHRLVSTHLRRRTSWLRRDRLCMAWEDGEMNEYSNIRGTDTALG